jgi:hypothetical protein
MPPPSLAQNVAKIYIDWKTCAKGGRDEEYLNILLSLGELLWHAYKHARGTTTTSFCAPLLYLLLEPKVAEWIFLALLTLSLFIREQNEVAVRNEYFIKRNIFLRDILAFSMCVLKRWIALFFSNLGLHIYTMFVVKGSWTV